jgi:hypothetical protein
MAKKGLSGYVEPPGAFQTAPSPSGGGNYQLVFPSGTSSMKQVFGKEATEPPAVIDNIARPLRGKPKKTSKFFHWSSRATRITAHKNANARGVTYQPR